MSGMYQFQFAEDNVYGHAFELIKRFGATSGVHLDLGCGYGAIAEPLRDIGLTYVGVDRSTDGLEDLRKRGFEVHPLNMADHEHLETRLRAILAERPLASISILDTLEHLPNDPEVLACIRRFVGGSAIPLIISVPNVAHRDIAFKLLGGQWTYTKTGLLDHTHVVHHTEKLLSSLMMGSGWQQVGRKDFLLELSDQHFPEDSVLLSPHSLLNKFLRQIRDGSDGNARVNQFVRAYLPGQLRAAALIEDRESPSRPFLTVILRTQGTRQATLRDALLCLTAQTCQDFEVLVVAHKVDTEHQIMIERQIQDLPAVIRSRIRFLKVDHGGRATPLNVGVENASGHYISMLDDDDLVFGHWVESFESAADISDGCVLRAVAVAQDIDQIEWNKTTGGFRTAGGIQKSYPTEYDLYAHLTLNFSPLMTLSFPRTLFQELGFRFDEELKTCEDWDLQVRAVLVCGVKEISETTGVYRRWRSGLSSYNLHSQKEWMHDHDRILSRLDAEPHLFPPGTVRKIASQNDQLQSREREIAELRSQVASIQAASINASSLDVSTVTKPLRYDIVDKINGALKKLPVIHSLFRASLRRLKQ